MNTRTVSARQRVPEETVGHVFTSIAIRNAYDVARAEDGELDPAAVRSIALERVLVDTGATSLCLPGELIETLGLRFLEEVTVTTATGLARSQLYSGAMVTIEGRTRVVQCLGLPGGRRPLLGVLPLEELGLEPDTTNGVLRVLPQDGDDTYFMIL